MTDSALRAYGDALLRASAGRSASLCLVGADGETRVMDLAAWCGPLRAGDEALLRQCAGPTLDVGCGPGRLATALGERGIPALGVDVSPVAVHLAGARGASVLRRSVFGRLPAEGRWHHILLADGNVGIGGDPVRLLARCRRLLAPGGTIIVECEPPGTPCRAVEVRLADGATLTSAFPWAWVGANGIGVLAGNANLRAAAAWTESDRWFAVLAR